MQKKKDLNLEITELFMAKAGNDFSRCFHGTIKRERTVDGKPVVRGKIKINGGFIWAEAEDQWKLGEMLDEMVVMILDMRLHEKTVVGTKICGTDISFN
jgi:hypothetical protein